MRSRVGGALIALVFCLFATMNAGGYRYGVGDQAFYLPAIERHLDPAAFPQDRVLIDDQDRLNVFTRAVAGMVRSSDASLPVLFVILYMATLLLVASGALGVAARLGLSPWAGAGVVAALALRHRVGMTGANTLEGYMHPRMLAFGVGLWAVSAVLRGSLWRAFGLTGVAFLIHPTTALWIGVWVGAAALVTERRQRAPLLCLAALAAAASVWAIWWGPLRAQVVVMDETWLGTVATKDYLFAGSWPWSMWLVAAVYTGLPLAAYALRRSRGQHAEREAGLVAGAMLLVTLFLVTLPAVEAKVALAVQFQISRVFWMLDVLATIYAVWFVVDEAGRRLAPTPARRWQTAAASILIVAAAARGVFVSWVEHPERPLVAVSLKNDDWQRAMDWLRTTPVDTEVLADPAHAWRYGTSVRVAAERDVYLEEVKDTAMSMYSRRVAVRVVERIRALENFGDLTAATALGLAARFGLDYLVSEARLDLPVAYRNARFTIYRLR